jgi:glutathione synthase/RimK-type ligase-like ATP-grasp enzyme
MPINLVTLDLTPILGLPAILRMSPRELRDFIVKTHSGSDAALIYMQMFYVLLALAQDDSALDMQSRALAMQRTYRIAGPVCPKIRLLAFMGPGNMLDNTPLDFVAECSSIQLDLLYLYQNGDFPSEIPEHDIAFVAVGESAKSRVMLEALESIYETWPRPILNRPANVWNCARDVCYSILRNIPGLAVPNTQRISKFDAPDVVFPCTIRPIDTHGGTGLARLNAPDELHVYFEKVPANAYYVATYIDCQSKDGYFRKIRLVFINGVAYACHLAVSENWMVHYLSAGMECSETKRAEEAHFMATFQEDFSVRHHSHLQTLARLLNLDYVTVDCAEMEDGSLVVFEVDTRGLVHAADPVDIFPYKPITMQKAFKAFECMLVARIQLQLSVPAKAL